MSASFDQACRFIIKLGEHVHGDGIDAGVESNKKIVKYLYLFTEEPTCCQDVNGKN